MIVERWKKRALLVSASLLLVLLGSATAWATVAKLMTVERLIERSDRIVHATVKSQKSQYDKRYNLVTTRTTIEVSKTYLGAHKKTLVIEQFGGQIEGLRTEIAGDARFEDEEEVILFLKDDPKKDLHYLTAMAQAKYSVLRSADGGVTIWRDLDGLSIYVPDADASNRLQHVSETPHAMPSFIATLETKISAIKGGKK